MALEPITRQEKIIAGQDLTPITRMEKFLKQFGGGGAIFRIYTSDDIVLQGGSVKYIVDEEVVRAVFQSINNKTQMPSICYASIGGAGIESNVNIPQQLNLEFGTALNSMAFGFVIAGTTYYIFDTYQNAYDYYNR